MSIEINYDETKKILIGVINGKVSVKQFQGAIKEILTSSSFAPDTNTLWDLNDLDFSSMDSDMQREFIRIRKNLPERGNAKLAFVAGCDLSYGMMRMYETLSSELEQVIMVFRDYDAAEQWLLK